MVNICFALNNKNSVNFFSFVETETLFVQEFKSECSGVCAVQEHKTIDLREGCCEQSDKGFKWFVSDGQSSNLFIFWLLR